MVYKAAVALFGIMVSLERLVEATAPKSRPHIVFIMADDLGWNDVSFHGSPQIPTPNLDALASTGVMLNNYYVMPVCSPSRGALLSGLYSIHVGFHNGVLDPAQYAALPLEVKIMPEHFKDLGYETHLVGKWHIGCYSLKYTPTYRGFDTFVGFHNGAIDYYSHVLNMDGRQGLDFWNNTEPLESANGTYATTFYTERAKHIISTRDKSKPLFLYLAHQATHSGRGSTMLQAPEEYVEKFPYIGDRNRRIYAGMTDALDQSVGAVLEALEAASMLDDTIIVFSSDNGGAPYNTDSLNDNMGSNWPLRGGKYTLWEGGIRSAAFVWAPQLYSHRRVSQQLMHVTDWLPTLYSAAGGDVNRLGRVDGFDMWQALHNASSSPREELLLNIDTENGNAALRFGKFKLLEGNHFTTDERIKAPGGSRPFEDLDALLRQSRAAKVLERLYSSDVFNDLESWRKHAALECDRSDNSNFVSNRARYLFNIEEDPCELHDLSQEQPQVVSMLLEKLNAYNKTIVPPVSSTIDPRGYPENNGGLWAPWI